MKLISADALKRQKQLKDTMRDINRIIRRVHRIKADFAKGSVWQRLINDLDEARVTARAILNLEEEDVSTEEHPQD